MFGKYEKLMHVRRSCLTIRLRLFHHASPQPFQDLISLGP